jgi:predicted N-acetyltransferase YhbS
MNNPEFIKRINIRLETPEDYYDVEEMARETFWDDNWELEPKISDMPLLISRLRECPSYVPELHFVAEIECRIVGHVIYSKSRIDDERGNSYETLTFGPISVLPEYQSKGIGKTLLRHSFAEAKRLGYRAVIIFGYPNYYPRAGFLYCSDFGISPAGENEYETADDSFMVYPLYDGALDGVHGKYYIDPVYFDLKTNDVIEYDKKFPPKELYVPVSTDAVLVRLKPDAQKSIRELNLKTLHALTTKSEREIRALNDIDDIAIDTIRLVMRENGKYW